MSSQTEKYCPYCGTLIPYLDEHCPSCGKQQPVMPGMTPRTVKPKKNVWIAVIASLVITGLGQVYIGEWKKGLGYFGGTIIIATVMSFFFDYNTVMTFGVIMAIMSAYDAYRTLTSG